MSIAGKKVIIAGAGIGGLTAAASLRHYCQEHKLELPTIIIYERDPTPQHRAYQGYSLTVRDGGGANVLRELGAYDQFKKKQTPGRRIIIAETTLEKPLFSADYTTTGSFRMARFELRYELLTLVPQEWIRWNTDAQSIEQFVNEKGEKKVRIQFTDGTTEEADLLIAADGIRSRVRRLVLTPQENELYYDGAISITGRSKMDVLPPLLEESFCLITEKNVSCFLASVSKTEAVWGINYISKVPKEEKRGDVPGIAPGLLEEAKSYAVKFPPVVQDILNKTELETMRLFSCRDRLPQASLEHIVFIGDANHPMSPFAANGANMAMLDGLSLAKELLNHKHKTIKEALQAFDKETKPRSSKAIMNGRMGITMLMTPNPIYIAIRNLLYRTLGFYFNHPTAFKLIGLTLLGLSGYGIVRLVQGSNVNFVQLIPNLFKKS